jgi:hypothetical protein
MVAVALDGVYGGADEISRKTEPPTGLSCPTSNRRVALGGRDSDRIGDAVGSRRGPRATA